MQESQTNPSWELLIDLAGGGSGPLHERLKRALRGAIRSGRLAAGATLPPSRVLAIELGCSRWAVTEAYAQLVAEGYLEARTGSGTRVRWAGAEQTRRPRPGRAERFREPMDLAPGLADLRAFPRARWAEALRGATLDASLADLGYGDPAGHRALRDVLLDYLERSRAASPVGADLVVTTSTTSGVHRLCRALVAHGHRSIAVEDPGWPQLAVAAREAGLEPVSVAVDEHGLRVADLENMAGPRAVLVAPAHQFPTGVVLAPGRRAALLRWAQRVDGLILEDDYDAEFRYDRAPTSTLQGMDPRRVALLGSLSKTLSPVLRIGWMLLPRRWTDLVLAEESVPAPPPGLDQLAFARMLTAGAYDRHLRRTRRAFRARRDLLVDELAHRLPGCRPTGVAAGLHLIVPLPERVAASRVVAGAEARGVRVADLDRYRRASTGPPGLVIGYGNIPDRLVVPAVAALSDVVREASP